MVEVGCTAIVQGGCAIINQFDNMLIEEKLKNEKLEAQIRSLQRDKYSLGILIVGMDLREKLKWEYNRLTAEYPVSDNVIRKLKEIGFSNDAVKNMVTDAKVYFDILCSQEEK